MTARDTFGEELRARRERAKLTQEQFAAKYHISLSLYKKIEGGKRRPQPKFVRWLDEFFDCPGTFERMYRLVTEQTYGSWFAQAVMFESDASRIHEWEMRGIPGLLQTADYARAVISAGRPHDFREAIEEGVTARIERQDAFTRDDPPKLWCVICESVLHRRVGGFKVMGAQLDHLIEMTDSPNLVLQVLPFESTDAPGVDGPIVMYEFPSGEPSVCYLEGFRGARVVENPAEVASIASTLNMIRGCASSPSESVSLIQKIRGEL